MSREKPSPESQVLGYLRRKTPWKQGALERAYGLKRGMLSAYESGHRSPGLELLYGIAGFIGYSAAEVDLALQRFRLPGGTVGTPVDGSEARPWGLGDADLRFCRLESANYGLVAARSFETRLGAEISTRRLRNARREADRLFRQLLALPVSRQRLAVEKERAYQSWLVVERICEASERAAAKDPKRALFLARLALHAAERFAGPEDERCRMRGYASIFVGNALRVRSDLREADQAFAEAERLWKQGKGARGVLLEEWRLIDGLAALRLDQRNWRETLVLQESALAVAPRSVRGRILLNKAYAFDEMGASRRALKALREAKPLIEEQGNPRQLFALRFNTVANLMHLGKLDEAERLLPEVRKMAIAQRLDLDLWRVSWLDGRIAGERGRLEEAVATLRRVRHEFTAREIAYDAALAGVDESVFLLEARDFARAKRVAEESLWVFQSRQVQEEALKALRVLHEAIKGELATAELAREVRDRFRRAG